MRIVVAGAVAAAPSQGGAAWAVLQYAHGFERLGHDVLVVEEAPDDPRVAEFFRDVMARSGLAGPSALIIPDGPTRGMATADLRRWMASADLLVNLAGVLRNRSLLELVLRRMYVDLDPGFTQCWHDVDGIDMNFAGHDTFVTVGMALGDPMCPVPTCGIDWQHSVPPVVLDLWPAIEVRPTRGLTTIGNWRSYGSTKHRGVTYGQKAHTARQFIALPGLVPEVPFEPALAIHRDERTDLDALAMNGWTVHDPSLVAGDLDRYRSFVQSSAAELGLAKSGYVASGSGWFSDRTACYLASGRPAIVQDTGWSRFLPSGVGLMAFNDVTEAADAVHEVLGSYDRHCKGARAVAEEHFDASNVLQRLLEKAHLA